jgi:hypothetical protein
MRRRRRRRDQPERYQQRRGEGAEDMDVDVVEAKRVVLTKVRTDSILPLRFSLL